ncbi:MAG: replicative DNA helicase [Clostridia bacterium]|nr:replicative DNA helicase [Clostridia bacterium]
MYQAEGVKTVPYSRQAEQSVLGAVLFDPEQISAVAGVLREEDFYLQVTREVFCAMLDLYHMGKPIDVVVLQDQLLQRGSLDSIGGLAYLSELAAGVPTTENLQYYIKIVKDKSTLRKLLTAAGEISELCLSEKEEVSVILDAAEQKIFDILQNKDARDFVTVGEVIPQTFAMLQKLSQESGTITGISTGIADLDKITAGLHNSDLILLAARPAVGKSAMALNIAQYAASRGKIPTAFFALEMSKEQLVSRLLCSEALVDAEKMKVGNLDANDWERLNKAAKLYYNAPFYLDDTASISINEIRSKCKRLKQEKNLGLIVIDYLQLMEGRRSESRQQEVSDISRSLKLMAKELDVPVIALSQLSRAPEQRSDHRPMLSDLRESGSIEQDADIVMFLYRDELYNENTEERNVAECLIAKHRSGSTGVVKMCFLGQFTKFCDLERQDV